jgi:hypothetical protein
MKFAPKLIQKIQALTLVLNTPILYLKQLIYIYHQKNLPFKKKTIYLREYALR